MGTNHIKQMIDLPLNIDGMFPNMNYMSSGKELAQGAESVKNYGITTSQAQIALWAQNAVLIYWLNTTHYCEQQSQQKI